MDRSALLAGASVRGRGLIGEKYLLQNVGTEPMVLAEPEFDRDGGEVAGVGIEHHNLRPGEHQRLRDPPREAR